MRFPRLITVYLLLLVAGCKSTRELSNNDRQLGARLKTHIEYLADDKLEGRRTGTAGEKLAREYISNQFNNYGLAPKGDNGYYQAFEVNDGKAIAPATTLAIGSNKLKPNEEFFPFTYSPEITINDSASRALQEAGSPWFIDLKEILEENKNNPHFLLPDYIRENSKKAAEKGATVVLLYNTGSIDDKLQFQGRDRSEKLKIPVVYISRGATTRYLNDPTVTYPISLSIKFDEMKRTGHNVIGYLDNKSATTVIIGAHYDHLGYGEDGNSRNTSKEQLIHNGADDNASGTAALIELAAKLKNSTATHNNYLFIAFSGEELGLYGSKYFTEHPTIDLKSVNYMINLDMVGRLNDSSKVLTIGGYGTSPSWSTVIPKEYFGRSNAVKKTAPLLTIRIDSSGTGPSDHTSFYRKDIPVLFYFTGLHTDYHKPSDDADKINYSGMTIILDQLMETITSVDNSARLAFTKTREAQTTTTARMNVTMGIMPDYTWSGNGLRADGVSEGKPAQKAGLKAGDIILQVGDYAISSMESYMQMLGKFRKGDKAKVKFKRGNELLETTVEF
jgi:aminopeptidase YwaD